MYLLMDFEVYNKSYEGIIDSFDEDNRLRIIRQKCIRNFIDRINSSRSEWDVAFNDILKKSQEENTTELSFKALSDENAKIENGFFSLSSKPSAFLDPVIESPVTTRPLTPPDPPKPISHPEPTPKLDALSPLSEEKHENFSDPDFSNYICVQEYIRIQEFLDQTRKLVAHINSDPNLKPFKNDLMLFIRTQINSISNSDTQHINSKTRLLTNLFSGRREIFQDRVIDASLDPQGQLFSMDLAAQTFVIVGTRLVNSVPAVARSMATIINGVIKNNIPGFRDLIMGQLLERCPYLVPMYPRLSDFSYEGKDENLRYKIACGYHYDAKANSLETEEKYLTRVRSMVLVFGCILIQDQIHQAWTWLAAFLSLEPQPVITATILQAFLQETSKKLSSTYGRQYKKLLAFIKDDYVEMIGQVTPKASDRQAFIKLKNLLSDDSQLLAAPSVSSIFGAVRFN